MPFAVRRHLDHLLDRLSAVSDVPEEARKFQRSRQLLESQIRARRGRWWQPWIAEDDLLRWGRRIRELETVAADLAPLLTEAANLRARARTLPGIAKTASVDAREPELESWWTTTARDLEMRLRRIGSEATRTGELIHHRHQLDEIRADLEAHEKAAQHLTEVTRGLRAVRNRPDMDPLELAPLDASLSELHDLLRENGPDEDWMKRMGKARQGTRELLERPVPEPPAEIKTVGRLLTEAERWCREAHLDPGEVQRLRQRRQDAAGAWKGREARDLAALEEEAQALRDRLKTKAQELRQRRLQRLLARLDSFFQACGVDDELEGDAHALETARVEQPQDHRNWLRDLDRLEQRFRERVKASEFPLRQRLWNRAEETLGNLTALDSQPLGPEVREHLHRVRCELEDLREPDDVEGVLRGLETVEDLRKNAMDLMDRAREEHQDVWARRDRLMTRHAAYEAAREPSGLSWDPPPTLPAFERNETKEDETDPLEPEGLEAFEEKLDAAETELETWWQGFREACEAHVRKERSIVERIVGALDQAGVQEPISLAPPSVPTDPEDAAAWTEAAASASRLREDAEHRLDAVWTELDQRRSRLGDALARIDEERLGPQKRHTWKTLSDDLQEPWQAPGENEDLEPRLRRLAKRADLLAEAKAFLESLERTRRRAETLRRELEGRLADFHRQRLGSPGHALVADRVEGLIHGVPETITAPEDALTQLETARELLTRLELHGRRWAAEELERAVETVRRRHQRLGGNTAESLDRLLAEVEAADPHHLPPPGLRRRIHQAARERA